MTKQEEKNTLRTFIDGLPKASYLHDILSECQLEIENCITNDIGFLSFSQRVQEQRAHIAEIGALQNTLNERKAECRKLDNDKAKLIVALDNAKSECRNLARMF